MGLFTYTSPGAGSSRRSRYDAPTFVTRPSPTGGQFRDRGFPERADISDHVIRGIGIAAQTPAYVYDRPLAALNKIAPVTGDIANAIRGIPVIGEHLSNAGGLADEALHQSFNAVPAAVNALDARGLEAVAGLPDDAELPFDIALGEYTIGAFNRFLPWMPKQTVGEYRRQLAKLGWTQQDVADIKAGRKGWLDFGEKKWTENDLLDFGGRMVVDPLNLVLGVGIISKAAKGTATYLRILDDGMKAAPAVMKAAPLGVREGVAAIVNGTYQGVTKRSLATFVQGWVRGSGPVFRAYRNVGLATTGVQVGVNTVDELFPDDVANSIPILESTFEFFRDMGNDKPLSDNALFQLWSVFNFPARQMLKTGYEKTRAGKVKVSRLDHEQRILEQLLPDMDGTNARKAAFVQQWGQPSFDNMMYQLLRTAIVRKAYRTGVGLQQRPFFGTSMAEFGHHLQGMQDWMTRQIGKALDEGSISGDDMVDALMTQFRGRGAILADETGGLVRQVFEPDTFMREWSEFEALGLKLSQTFQQGAPVVPGLSSDLVTMEQIDWLIDMVKADTVNGKISAAAANSAFQNVPAIFKFDKAGTFARAMTRSADQLDAAAIRKHLREVKADHAVPLESWMAEAKAWEAREARTQLRARDANRVIERDGQLSQDSNPDYGNAEVVVPTAAFRRGQRTGAPVGYVSQVRQLRGQANVAEVERVVPLAMREAGYQIDAAVQGASVDGKVVSSAQALRAAPGTDFQTLAEMAVHAAERAGVDRAQVILRGDDLAKNGVPANAAEFRWDTGTRSPEEWDRLTNLLRRDFGDRVFINDTAGTVRVVVRESDTALADDLEKRLERVGRMLGGEGKSAPAFVQELRKKVSKSDPAGTRSFQSVSDIGRRSHRWHAAKSRLNAKRDDLPADAGPDTRPRVDGDGRDGAPVEAPGQLGGVVPDGPARSGPDTRWERANRRSGSGEPDGELGLGAGPVAGGTRDAGVLGAYTGRVRDAARGNARGGSPSVPADAARFITADKHSGAWVTADGELLLWHKPRTAYGDDWGAVLADASDAATWTRVPDVRARRGLSPVDSLADHGWSVVARDNEGVVYLVRDRAQTGRGIPIPPREFGQGGYASIRNRVPEMSLTSARLEAQRAGGRYGVSVPAGALPVGTGRPRSQHPAMGGDERGLYLHLTQEVERRYGQRIRGQEVISPDDPRIPDTIYHVTTDLPAVQKSGYLRASGEGGLGGDHIDRIVSMTIDREVAEQLAEDLRFNARVSRSPIEDVPRLLQEQADIEGWGDHWRNGMGATLQKSFDEGSLRYSPHDWLTQYFSSRTTATNKRNPIIFGEAGKTVDPARVGIVEIPKTRLRNDALLVDFDLGRPSGLQEVRSYGDVPLGKSAPESITPWGQRLIEINEELATLRSTLKHPNKSKRYQDLQSELNEMMTTGRVRGATPDVTIDTVKPGAPNRHKFVDTGKSGSRRTMGLCGDCGETIGSIRHSKLGSNKFLGVVKREASEAADSAEPPLPPAPPVPPVRRTADEAAIPHRGALTFLWDLDAENALWKPNFHPSVSRVWDDLAPDEQVKLQILESELKQYDPTYTLKLAPEQATPFFMGQGDAYRQMVAGRRMASDNLFHKLTGPLAAAQHALLDPIYTRDLHDASRQVLYDELVAHGASVKEVNHFLKALYSQYLLSPQVRHAKVFRRPDALPGRTIDQLATGVGRIEGFEGFRPAVQKSIAASGDTMHDIVQRAGSRFYRGLSERYSTKDGSGSLQGLAETLYGRDRAARGTGASSVARSAAWITRTWYHVFRFIIDPRWHLMNEFEADILGFARAGFKAQRSARLGGQANTVPSKATQVHGGGLGDELGIEQFLHEDAMASGMLDQRRIAGFIGQTFDVERVESTKVALREMIEKGDPMYADLRREFGGGPDEIVAGLEKMLYDWDTKGAKQTLLDEVAEIQIQKDRYGLFDRFLTNLYHRHQQIYKDVVHTFHGNANRANLERIVNSPFLWWPISYQLKAGKWVIDLMTNRFLGSQTDLAGAWTLERLLSHHNEALQEDPGYAAMWNDHPALWRAVSMVMPMTPFDMGVFMGRWTRYSASWVGSELGLWEEDPSYPHDPANFITRSIVLGPQYSSEILQDVYDELSE